MIRLQDSPTANAENNSAGQLLSGSFRSILPLGGGKRIYKQEGNQVVVSPQSWTN